MLKLGARLQTSRALTPSWENVFKAYATVSPAELKVLIIGQDPYPTANEACGLAFSSGTGKTPYSLKNIFTDLHRCFPEKSARTCSDLSDWASQGVMLLNTCLTTETGIPFAHKGWGWEVLIAETLKVINELPQPYVVFGWGKPAQKLIDSHIKATDKHLILRAAHPANERYEPNSYIGSKHFATADTFLLTHKIKPINWL
jgi:uracil-DNA glycosylase